MDAKTLIQKAWVLEAMALLVFVCAACAWMPLARLEVLARVLIPIVGTILGQGVAASAGPEVKRFLESRKVKVEKPGR